MCLLLEFSFQGKVFIEDVIELVVAEYLVDLLHMPLLDVVGMRIGKIEQAL